MAAVQALIMNETTLEPQVLPSLTLPAHAGLAIAGHFAFGASLGLGYGARALASSALVAPLAITVALASMLPLFYIASTLRGNAPSLATVISASTIAWRDAGIIMLGAFPASWFLISSFANADMSLGLIALEAFICTRLALASFRRNVLAGDVSAAGRLGFFVWGVLVVTMATRLFSAWVMT